MPDRSMDQLFQTVMQHLSGRMPSGGGAVPSSPDNLALVLRRLLGLPATGSFAPPPTGYGLDAPGRQTPFTPPAHAAPRFGDLTNRPPRVEPPVTNAPPPAMAPPRVEPGPPPTGYGRTDTPPPTAPPVRVEPPPSPVTNTPPRVDMNRRRERGLFPG